jgi:hypothetical protein
VFWGGQDRVTGFWGLALAGMPPHRTRHAGTGLSASCAWHPLFLALVVGDLQVTTADPVTGKAITYDIAQTAPSPAPPTPAPCCRSCAPIRRGTTT